MITHEKFLPVIMLSDDSLFTPSFLLGWDLGFQRKGGARITLAEFYVGKTNLERKQYNKIFGK